MRQELPLDAFIFDLGDVLFKWSSTTNTTVPSRTLRSILSSATWHDYECGRLSREACYEKIAREFSLQTGEVAKAFSEAHQSLRQDDAVVGLISSLRYGGIFKVYAMSNVGKEDFAALSDKMDWSLFDGVYTSGQAGMRKPDKEFYRFVLERMQIAPERVVFVDDKHENALAAETLGIHSMVFNDSTIHDLQRLVDDPFSRGIAYLHRHAQQLTSITDNGVSVPDNFAQLLILEATQDS
jgi:epoxide hydrolase-like predicted phosphatase